jgi:hypothetical protein
MTTIGAATEVVRDDERALIDALVTIGGRHRDDHDIFHISRTLIRLHEANLEALGGDGQPQQRFAAGGSLLGDLRALHLLYAQASIDWVILGQGAQAVRDAALLETVSRCHPETLRGMKWTVTRLKLAAPQVLAGNG